jgi:hypothetical protein
MKQRRRHSLIGAGPRGRFLPRPRRGKPFGPRRSGALFAGAGRGVPKTATQLTRSGPSLHGKLAALAGADYDTLPGGWRPARRARCAAQLIDLPRRRISRLFDDLMPLEKLLCCEIIGFGIAKIDRLAIYAVIVTS